jgi:hypothetical protein
VFAGNLSQTLFPHLVAWLKKEKSGKIPKIYDFKLI